MPEDYLEQLLLNPTRQNITEATAFLQSRPQDMPPEVHEMWLSELNEVAEQIRREPPATKRSLPTFGNRFSGEVADADDSGDDGWECIVKKHIEEEQAAREAERNGVKPGFNEWIQSLNQADLRHAIPMVEDMQRLDLDTDELELVAELALQKIHTHAGPVDPDDMIKLFSRIRWAHIKNVQIKCAVVGVLINKWGIIDPFLPQKQLLRGLIDKIIKTLPQELELQFRANLRKMKKSSAKHKRVEILKKGHPLPARPAQPTMACDEERALSIMLSQEGPTERVLEKIFNSSLSEEVKTALLNEVYD